jgi:hypothetical protein
MSLQPQEVPPVPDETRRITRAAFPKGNVYIRMSPPPEAFAPGHPSGSTLSYPERPAQAARRWHTGRAVGRRRESGAAPMGARARGRRTMPFEFPIRKRVVFQMR